MVQPNEVPTSRSGTPNGVLVRDAKLAVVARQRWSSCAMRWSTSGSGEVAKRRGKGALGSSRFDGAALPRYIGPALPTRGTRRRPPTAGSSLPTRKEGNASGSGAGELAEGWSEWLAPAPEVTWRRAASSGGGASTLSVTVSRPCLHHLQMQDARYRLAGGFDLEAPLSRPVRRGRSVTHMRGRCPTAHGLVTAAVKTSLVRQAKPYSSAYGAGRQPRRSEGGREP